MKYLYIVVVMLSIILSSCAPQLKPSVTPTLVSTSTPSLIPSRTPLPTNTPLPSKTPLPTKTPTPTFLPVGTLAYSDIGIGTALPQTAEKITVDNVQNMTLLASWGQGVLSDLAYSPDGNLLAIGTTAGVAIYDAHNIRNRKYFLNTLTSIDYLAFAPDGDMLAVASNDPPKIQIWQISSQNLVKEIFISNDIVGGVHVQQIGFSADGKYFAATNSKSYLVGNNELNLWQISDWNNVHKASGIGNFSFSPDGKVILLISEKTASFYNLSDWKSTKPFPVEWVTSSTFSQDGTKVIIGSVTGTVKVVDSESGELVYEIKPLGYVRSEQQQYACDDDFTGFDVPEYMPPFVRDVKLTHHGNTFAVYYDYDGSILSSVRIYNINDGSFVDEYTGNDIKGFDFAPDTQSLALNMRRIGSVHIWNTGNKELTGTIHSFNTPAYDMRFSPDGEWLAVTYGDSTRIRRITDGSMLRNAQAVMAFSPLGEMIALGADDGTISLENIAGTTKTKFAKENGWVYDLIYAHNGDLIISTTDQCDIHIRRASDGALIKELESPTAPGMNVETTRIAVAKLLSSIDGNYLVGGDVFGSLAIWNLADGTMQRANTGENDPKGQAMSLSPDGKTLAIAEIGNIQLHDITENKPISNIQIPSDKKYSYTVTAVAFSNDGNLLAAGLDDGTIYIFQTTDFKPVYHFQAHHHADYEGVLSLTFSPDNSILVSAGYDGTVKLWGVAK